MSRRIRGATATLGTLCALAAGCGGDGGIGPPLPPPPPSGPGAIGFDVATAPGAEHGAILLTVAGGAVDSVTAAGGYEAFQTLTTAGARAIVVGAIADGPLIRVWVPDVARADRYSVQVEEGALRGSYATVPAGNYAVTRGP